jgi:hypothetical protein
VSKRRSKLILFKTWFLEEQGARPSELTRKLATTALKIYCIHIFSFSAYLPQLAGFMNYMRNTKKGLTIVAKTRTGGADNDKEEDETGDDSAYMEPF